MMFIHDAAFPGSCDPRKRSTAARANHQHPPGTTWGCRQWRDVIGVGGCTNTAHPAPGTRQKPDKAWGLPGVIWSLRCQFCAEREAAGT